MKRLDLEYIKNVVRELGHEPLFDKPVVNRDFIQCKCKKHGVFTVKVENLLHAYRSGKGNGCRKCGDASKITIEQVYKKFEELNLQPQFTKYQRATDNLPFICKKHPELGIQYTKFINLQHGILRPCKKCSSENLSKKHTKPFKTKRIYDPKRRSSTYRKWRNIILNIFHNSCIRCGSTKKLRVHHIQPVKLFPDNIIDIINGVVLCEECHKEYHKRYKLNDNTINHKIALLNFIKELKFIPNWIIKDTNKEFKCQHI